MTRDDARNLVVARYGQIIRSELRNFYDSVDDRIKVAALELVHERILPADMAEDAARDAAAFVARGGRAR